MQVGGSKEALYFMQDMKQVQGLLACLVVQAECVSSHYFGG